MKSADRPSITTKHRDTDLTRGSILDKVLLFAIPLALTSMLQQLFNAADVAVLGKFASANAMAAVGSNAPVVSLLVNSFVGLSIGANVVIARNIGAKHPERASKAVHTAMALALICGVVVAVLGNLVARPIITLLGVPEEVFGYSLKYLRIYFTGMPFIMLYNFEASIFRSNGNTKTPLICLTVGGVLNVAANLFFVLVMGMDVEGVAIATVLANAVSSMLLLYYLRREESVIRVELRNIRIHRPALVNIVRIGVPSALQSMVFSISNLCVQSAVNSLGPDVMAASSAAFNVEIFVFFIINAFTQTCVTFVGQNYGAKEYARCRLIVRRILMASWCVTMVASITIILTQRMLLGLFTDDPAIIELGTVRVSVLMYSETLNVFMDNLSGALRGLGKSLIPAIVTFIGVCGTRITWVFTGFRIYHSWLSLMLVFPVSWGISAAIIIIMYIKTRNKLLPVNDQDPA
ncbi:MAG: MATE family efflux transporter [Mogibacterium sp.]|nr:MATE family efflux transporter [Mogibacterium sp.]MBR2540731.1 MATE family efflux transporter [Mogibacterium sp.]